MKPQKGESINMKLNKYCDECGNQFIRKNQHGKNEFYKPTFIKSISLYLCNRCLLKFNSLVHHVRGVNACFFNVEGVCTNMIIVRAYRSMDSSYPVMCDFDYNESLSCTMFADRYKILKRKKQVEHFEGGKNGN